MSEHNCNALSSMHLCHCVAVCRTQCKLLIFRSESPFKAWVRRFESCHAHQFPWRTSAWHQAPKTRSSVAEDFLPRQVRRLFSRLPFEATTFLFSHSRHPNITCSLDI